MKLLKILILCVFQISILGCDKNESENLKNLDVEEYVEQLKKMNMNYSICLRLSIKIFHYFSNIEMKLK